MDKSSRHYHAKKNMTRAPARVNTFRRPTNLTPRTPHPPKWFHQLAEAGYSLMQQSDCCKRTEKSTTLDPQWLSQPLPSCNPCKNNHIPLLECPPN